VRKRQRVDNRAGLWASAIAQRVSDEWAGKSEFPEDSELLAEVLAAALSAVPDQFMRLVGTGVIEETYFQALD